MTGQGLAVAMWSALQVKGPAAAVDPSCTRVAPPGAGGLALRLPPHVSPGSGDDIGRSLPRWGRRPGPRSHLDELDSGQGAEVPPGGGVVAQVHPLVVRAARGQPPVQAGPDPGRGAELP